MRRLLAPFVAAIAAAFALALIVSWTGFGDAAVAGIAGFVGGVIAIAGAFYALGPTYAETPRPDVPSVESLRGVEPDVPTVPADERQGLEVLRAERNLVSGNGGDGGEVVAASVPLVVSAERTQRVHGLVIEGSVEPVEVCHP